MILFYSKRSHSRWWSKRNFRNKHHWRRL